MCVCVCVGQRVHKDVLFCFFKYKSVCTVTGSKCVFQGQRLLEKYVKVHCFGGLREGAGALAGLCGFWPAFCCLEVCMVK